MKFVQHNRLKRPQLSPRLLRTGGSPQKNRSPAPSPPRLRVRQLFGHGSLGCCKSVCLGMVQDRAQYGAGCARDQTLSVELPLGHHQRRPPKPHSAPWSTRLDWPSLSGQVAWFSSPQTKRSRWFHKQGSKHRAASGLGALWSLRKKRAGLCHQHITAPLRWQRINEVRESKAEK